MNSNQSQGQSQQQPGQERNTSPGQQRADHTPDIHPVPEPGTDGAAPGKGDSNRTPWQGQQPVGQPHRQPQDDAIAREQQQQGSPSEDTDDVGDTSAGNGQRPPRASN